MLLIALRLLGEPDVAGAGITEAFTPGRHRVARAVDGHLEVVTVRLEVAVVGRVPLVVVARHIGGYLGFGAPGRAAVGRRSIPRVPASVGGAAAVVPVAVVHPADTDITGAQCGQRWKGVISAGASV